MGPVVEDPPTTGRGVGQPGGEVWDWCPKLRPSVGPRRSRPWPETWCLGYAYLLQTMAAVASRPGTRFNAKLNSVDAVTGVQWEPLEVLVEMSEDTEVSDVGGAPQVLVANQYGRTEQFLIAWPPESETLWVAGRPPGRQRSDLRALRLMRQEDGNLAVKAFYPPGLSISAAEIERACAALALGTMIQPCRRRRNRPWRRSSRSMLGARVTRSLGLAATPRAGSRGGSDHSLGRIGAPSTQKAPDLAFDFVASCDGSHCDRLTPVASRTYRRS